MKIITKVKPEVAELQKMFQLQPGVYTGVIMPSSIPGIVIVSNDGLPLIIYCFEGGKQWLNARELGNSHLIKNPVRVKIETINTIAV